jgi:plastocyanin
VVRSTSGRNALIGLALAAALVAVGCSSGSPSSSGGGGSNAVEQGTNGQLVFSPSTVTAKRGATLTIKNVGSVAHTFTVTGQGIDITNDVGQTRQVTLSIAPGTYAFVCRFHEGSGMTGTLTVTG